MKFTSPDIVVVARDTWAGYLPERDADGNGLPDNLANPDFGPVEGGGMSTRIPMLP